MEVIKAWLKYIVALLRGDDKASTPTESTPEPTPAPAPSNVERHKVAGISYRTSAVLSLGTKNPEYNLTKKQIIDEYLTDQRLYWMEFGLYPCELIPEPDNPEDPKAIKVVVRGEHIGYIKKGSCAHIHKLLREDRIESVSCDIGGGDYKIVVTDYDDYGNETYTLEKENTPYYAVVVIKVKDKTPAG